MKSILDQYGMRDMFLPKMPGLSKAFYFHLCLMKKYLPKLHTHLLNSKFDQELIVIKQIILKNLFIHQIWKKALFKIFFLLNPVFSHLIKNIYNLQFYLAVIYSFWCFCGSQEFLRHYNVLDLMKILELKWIHLVFFLSNLHQ